MLYSVELRSQAFAIVLFLNCGAKVGSFFHTTKLFANFLRKKCEKCVFPRPSGCRARLARAKCAARLLALGRRFGLKSRHFFCRLGILGYLCIMQAALGKQEASFLSSRLHCLSIMQAALGKQKASFLSSRLHCLSIMQAALGKQKAGFLSSRLHCLCIMQAALGKQKAGFLSSRLHCR